MSTSIESRIPVRRISPDDGAQYFFGYYDNPAYDPSGRFHLCHRAPYDDRIPGRDDVCELGLLDVRAGTFEPFATTTAWNFQQGAMLQYDPLSDGEAVYYNVREGNEYRCIWRHLATNKTRMLPLPVANVSRDGRFGLSINFNRVFDFRPGYGYSGVRDEWFDVAAPAQDGAFVMNMQTGQHRLVLSYAQIADYYKEISPEKHGKKLVINHITFNADASRFVFLARDMPEQGKEGQSAGFRYKTAVGTVERSGGGLRAMTEFASLASHYHWRDERNLLIYGQCRASDERPGMLLIDDETGALEVLSPEFFIKDIHCIYSPDLRYILGDGYPWEDGMRRIYLYDTQAGKGIELLRCWSKPVKHHDCRTDLHNRWRPDGRQISFDSTHEGNRGVYVADLDEKELLFKG